MAIKWNTTDLSAELKRIHENTRRVMTDAAQDVVDRFRVKFSAQRLSASGRSSLGVRRGALRRSLTASKARASRGVITARVFFRGKRNNVIASTHETGATIRPKQSKYLTVPLPAALTAGGVPRKRSARQWPNTFVKKSKAGNLIIFQRRKGRGRRAKTSLVPLYVLKRSVKIPARLNFRKDWRAFNKREGRAIIRAAVKRAKAV